MADAATISVLVRARDMASDAFKRVEANAGGMAQGIAKHRRSIGLAMVAMGGAMTGFALASVKAASTLEESMNAVNVVFSEGSKTIHEFGENSARAVGLSTAEFNQLATVTGALLQDVGLPMTEVAGMTNELAVRAADLASVFDTSVQDAMSAMNQALRGETEAIRRYAGDVTQATLETFALSQGINKSVSEMSEQEKRLLRVGLIMEQTSSMAGDFANTSESLANRMRIAKAEFANVSAELGTALLPLVTSLVEKVQGVLMVVADWIQQNPELAKKLMITASVLGVVGVAVGTLALSVTALIVAMSPITLVILGVAAAITGIIILFKKWDDMSTKVKIAVVALGFALGPVTALIVTGIAVWKNWDKIVDTVRKGIGIFTKSIIGFIIKLGEGFLAITKWIPGMGDARRAIEGTIDSLRDAQNTVEDWGNNTGRVIEEHGQAWSELEDSHWSTSGAIKTQNEQIGASTVDLNRTVGTSTASMVQSHVGLQRATEMTAEAAELGWGAVEDAVLQAQGVTIKSLDEIIKAQEDLELSLDSNLASIRSNMDATNIQWKESGKSMENVVQAWADIMDMEIEDVLARMDELNVDTNNVKATLNTFTDETGRNFFTWADNVDAATKQAALSLANTEATLQTQMDKYQDILIGGFNVKQLDLLGWTTNEINNAMDEQVKKLEEAEQRLADRMSNIGGREESREAGSIQRNIHALGVGTGQTTVLGAFQAIQSSAKWGAPSHRTMMKGMKDEDILDAILESAGAEAALGSHDAIRAAGLADLFGLDQKQRGGLSKGGLTLVGEGGPEIVSLPGGSFVHPNGTSPGGVTNQFHFHGSVYGVEDLKEAVVEAVRDHAISGGFSGVFAEA